MSKQYLENQYLNVNTWSEVIFTELGPRTIPVGLGLDLLLS